MVASSMCGSSALYGYGSAGTSCAVTVPCAISTTFRYFVIITDSELWMTGRRLPIPDFRWRRKSCPSSRSVRQQANSQQLVASSCLKCREGHFEQRLLFHLMRRVRTSRWARRRRALHRAERPAARQTLQLRRQEIQRAHVGWLFLNPQQLARVRMLRQCRLQFLLRQREKLFQENDCDFGVAAALAFAAQFVPDLARAENDALSVADRI